MAGVQAAIDDRALAEGAGIAVSIVHVCLACGDVVRADGVGLSLITREGGHEPVYATEERSEALAESQVAVGEGPGVTAFGEGRPVLVPDLDCGVSQRRWPLFVPAAVERGVAAVFAFPLLAGAIAVGVLEICRNTRGALSEGELADALLFTDAALLQVLHAARVAAATPVMEEPHPFGGGIDRWPEVHQATGMVSVQLGTDLAEAFMRLRAHAYSSDRSLREIAREVVERRLRFDPD
jgi:hypothetical protein